MKDRRPYTYVVIDFEGNQSRIKEFSYLLIRENKIAQCKCIEYGDTKIIDEEITELSKANYDFIVSHNYTVEKNILKKYLPYVHNDGKILHWGPWIDTCRIYSTLYPQLLDYKLRFLTELFIAEKELSIYSNKLCDTQKRTFHNATYDCICTMLIFDRVLPIIALDDFLQD
jgi:DNA polymerase III epsilon subunit-like protein